MARTSPGQPEAISFAAGVDNRSHPTSLPDGFVQRADNVDIDPKGVGKTREGYSLFTALPGAHSLWRHPLLAFALVGDASTLRRVDADGTLTTLVTGLNGNRISYAVIGRHAYWSNTVQTGRLSLDGVPAGWGVETPLPSYGVTASSNGGLFAGRYGVTLTFANAAREEGGASESVFVDVPEGGGITISDVPVSENGEATEARVYVTGPNGTDLFHAGSVVPGAATFLVGAGERMRLLETQFCEPFPPAGCLLGKAGRLLGAMNRYLVWSQAMYYGLWRPAYNNLALPSEITMIAAPDSPQFLLYVATRDEVFVLQGDSIDTHTLSSACDAGAIPGSMTMVPAQVLKLDGVTTAVPVWAGTDGVPYAGTLAGVVPLSEHFVYPLYDEAAATYVKHGGQHRLIVSGRGGRSSALAMGDSVSAEVIQAGP